MDSDTFYTLAIALSFLFVAVLTVINLFRHRDTARLDIALPFVALAIIFIVPVIQDLLGEIPPLGFVSSATLMALPYLFVRLLKHFRAVPAYIGWAPFVGFGLSV